MNKNFQNGSQDPADIFLFQSWVRQNNKNRIEEELSSDFDPAAAIGALETAIRLEQNDVVPLFWPFVDTISVLKVSVEAGRLDLVQKILEQNKSEKNDHFLATAALNALNKKTFKQSREKQEKDVEREIALALIDDISKPEMLIEKNLLLSAVRSNDKEICQKILEKTKNQNSLCAGMIGLEHTESPEMYHFLKSHLTGEMRPPIGYLMERLIEKTDKSPLFDCLLEDADDGDKINVCIKAAQFKKWDLVQFIWDEVFDKELWGKQEIVS